MPKIFEYAEAKQVAVCGDIHGGFRALVSKLCVQYGCTDTLLIVAGDCGFGFEKPAFYETEYNHVAGCLRKANDWVVFVRGNHDNPAYFREERVAFRRWRTVPDYSVVRAAGHDVFCAGGAISVDRMSRRERNAQLREMGHIQVASWWPDEAPVFDAEQIGGLPDNIRIDTVVTHTAPSFCQLLTNTGLKKWAWIDPMLLRDVDDERKTMDNIHRCLLEHGHPIKEWFYGHFHQTWNYQIDGIWYHLLDELEIREVR